MYSDIQKRNEEILKQHDKILQTLRSNGVDYFDLEDVKQELREQIEIIGPNNVNTNVSFRDFHQVKSLIVSAGYNYPMDWDEFGSSEKDLWEERVIANIERQQSRAAR